MDLEEINEESLRLRREEVRGVFVIGLLALLLTMKLDPSYVTMSESYRPLNLLILYWGLYIGFVVVGVSSDYIDELVSRSSWELAGGFFFIGIGLTAVFMYGYLFGVASGHPIAWGRLDFRYYGTLWILAKIAKDSKHLVSSIIRDKKLLRADEVAWLRKMIVNIVTVLPVWVMSI
jgi:hypothetical protein